MFGNVIRNFQQQYYAATMQRLFRQGKLSVPFEYSLVSTPVQAIVFFDDLHAQQWIEEHPEGSPTVARQHNISHYEPSVMRWVLNQRAQGRTTGDLHAHIMFAHPENMDDILACFRQENVVHSFAAMEMLKFAFATGRSGATQAIAEWAKRNPRAWFNPQTLVGKDDDAKGLRPPYEEVCLFGRLMSHPAIMQWLFHHQLHMKHEMLRPENWNALQEQIQHGIHPNHTVLWPATSHHVFRADANVLNGPWPVNNPDVASHLMAAYTHDPAAQCYLVHQFVDTPIKNALVQHACPEAVALHVRIQSAINPQLPNLPPPTLQCDNDKVDALMLGIHLGLSHRDFYYHAQTVFTPHLAKNKDIVLQDMDSSLF